MSVDCTGPLPITNSGNTHIIVLQDLFTRFTEIVPLPDIKASTVAEVVLNTWILRYGPMGLLLSDNGSEFSNKVLQLVCNILFVKKVFTTPYHPQANGQVERANQTLKKLIASQISIFQNQWDH